MDGSEFSFRVTDLFRVSLISLCPVYRIFPLVSGTFRACLSCSGAVRRVLGGFCSSSDSLPLSLLSLSLDDALDTRRIPPRSRVARGELGRASACSMLSALEERSRIFDSSGRLRSSFLLRGDRDLLLLAGLLPLREWYPRSRSLYGSSGGLVLPILRGSQGLLYRTCPSRHFSILSARPYS